MSNTRRWRQAAVALALLAQAASGTDAPALKDAAPKGLLIGAALSRSQVEGQDAAALELATRHFNSITPENLLKWALVHPEPGRYDFEPADRLVALGSKHGMKVVGHTLVWHRQTPAWVFEGKDGRAADRETLLARLREHILAVVGRYKGRIHGWDVVNEAIDEDGTWRKTKWHEILGDDLVAKAFEYAHEADPQAELYYNDFNLWIPAKRQAALRVVKDLRARGLRVDGVGEQGHYLLDRPPLDQVEAAITDIAAAGLKVMITELDVDVLPRPEGTFGADLERQQKLRAETDIYREGLPEAKQQELARRYADLVGLFVAHRDKVTRITLWGVTDAQTWLNNFPMRGRVNHALLWDRSARPKPAFDAVARALAKR